MQNIIRNQIVNNLVENLCEVVVYMFTNKIIEYLSIGISTFDRDFKEHIEHDIKFTIQRLKKVMLKKYKIGRVCV